MLEQLLACAGEWHGTNVLQDPGSNIPQDTTDSVASVSPLLEGRFVRIDYTWSYKGKPQSGSMLVGHRKKSGAVTLHWIDSWHNGDAVMACEGTGSDGRLMCAVLIPRRPALIGAGASGLNPGAGPSWSGWTTSRQRARSTRLSRRPTAAGRRSAAK